MKRIWCVLLVIVIALGLCACGGGTAKITETQKAVCSEADDFFKHMASSLELEFSSEINEKDSKILYIATLNIDGDFSDENAKLFGDEVMPIAEEMLSKEDVYIVLYLNESGEQEYRIVDSKLDPSFLD